MSPVRLVCLSDTHDLHSSLEVPDGDILIHAGDFTSRGRVPEVEAFGRFLSDLPHRHKIVVAGNHDFLFEREPARAQRLLEGVHYLEHEEIEYEGVRFFGSPWQPRFFDWAFNLDRGKPLAEKWATVPEGIDVLITHTPPHGILDRVARGENVGCADLREALSLIQPKLHVFGHIHEARGVQFEEQRVSVNACNCDLAYQPVHPPIVIDWEETGPTVVTRTAR